MEEKLKKALNETITSKINDLNRQKDQILTKGEQLSKLSELIDSLEKGFEKLKDYSRDMLETILSPYYANNALVEELDRLEIVRFVYTVQDKGHSVELNEEEIDIMVHFLEKITNEKNVEYQKYEKISLKSKEQLSEEIKVLVQIEEKVSKGENGKKIVMGKEIDKIMQLAIEEEADEETQIAILCLINRINLGINDRLNKEAA